MKVPFFRTPYNYDAGEVSVETGRVCEGPSRTVQSQAEEADINNIVSRFIRTGQLPENWRTPSVQDFSESVTDYHSAMNLVRSAQESFMALPAQVRSNFDNDPGLFLDFMEGNPSVERLQEVGLVPKDARTVAAAAPAAAAGGAPQGAGSGAPSEGSPAEGSGGRGPG